MRSFVLCFLFLSQLIYSQDDSTYIDLSAYVVLDSITISAKRKGFSLGEFMRIIQNDESTEKAFVNLRSISYKYENDIKFFRNNGALKGSYRSEVIQHFENKCQWMEVEKEEHSNNYYTRNQSPRFYTSKLYHRIFFVPQQPCSERSHSPPTKKSKAVKLMESRIAELKKLIYTPGKQASIPLIGSKTAIFEKGMIDKYEFTITSEAQNGGSEVYVFRARVKAAENAKNPDNTIVKYLEVIVEKRSLQVLSRNYKLKYNAGVYDFDLVMKVDLNKHENKYVPTSIVYDGYWKVVGKRKEDCKFKFKLTEFL